MGRSLVCRRYECSRDERLRSFSEGGLKSSGILFVRVFGYVCGCVCVCVLNSFQCYDADDDVPVFSGRSAKHI